jgi:hypothetical protein
VGWIPGPQLAGNKPCFVAYIIVSVFCSSEGWSTSVPNTFFVRSGAKQGFSLQHLLFSLVIKDLNIVIRQEKEIKGIQVRKNWKSYLQIHYLIYGKLSIHH